MDVWPLLDIKDALADCDVTLVQVVGSVETLHLESESAYPPDAAQFLSNLVALRELQAGLTPPALHQAIEDEQTVDDEEEARWEPTH
jgi:hypothetical protein